MPPVDPNTSEMLDHVIEQGDLPYQKPSGETAEGDDTSGKQPTRDGADAADGDAAAPRDQQRQTDAGKQPGQRDAAKGKGKETLKPPARLTPDANGNLVDAQGRVIAQPGRERREYEQALRVSREYQQQNAQLRGELAGYQRAHADISQLGNVTSADLPIAARLLSDFRKNPVEVVKSLISHVRSLGLPLEIDGAAVDTAAVREMVQREMAPVRDAAQRRQQEAQIAQEVERSVGELYNEFPMSRAHEPTLAVLVGKEGEKHAQNPNYRMKTLRELFLEVQTFAAIHSLDINRDLFTQINERAKAAGTAGQQQQEQQRTAPPRQRGLPPGRGTDNGGSPRTAVNGRSAPAPLGTPVEDRVLAAMRENGIQV